MYRPAAHFESNRPLMANPGEDLRAACEDIASTIRQQAFRARDGNIYWRQPDFAGRNPGLVGPHIFPGTVGIALFLSAASCVLEDRDDLRALSLQGLEPLRREIREIVADPARARAVAHPIGGLTGLGSLIYGLTRIGDFLADRSLIEDAHRVTALITPERIAADDQLDVMLGCAGTLLALLALDERQPTANAKGVTPLELAFTCADHLRARIGAPLAAGFCHGAAGISSALARLYERSGEPWLLELAERSLAAERDLDVPAARNWKVSDEGEPRIYNSWCKGAPGIALGRLALLGLSTDDPLVEKEISVALDTAAAAPLSETDDLCCGNAGRIEVLIEAHRRLGDATLLAAAHHLADSLIERAGWNGFYSLPCKGGLVLDVRFFPGLAGLGYTLLRLVAVERLPSVAAMS